MRSTAALPFFATTFFFVRFFAIDDVLLAGTLAVGAQ
jgi:hypothetical protein